MIPSTILENLQTYQVGEQSIERLLGASELMEVKSQSLLVRPGEVCDKAFLILNGAFVCRFIDEDKEIMKTINFYTEELHPFMSCVDSYFTGHKTQCELRAVSASTVIMLDKKTLEQILDEDENLFKFYHSLVTTALYEENDLKLKIIAYSSEQLYQYILTELPSIVQRFPSKYIAEFMGISAEWLSKLKHR